MVLVAFRSFSVFWTQLLVLVLLIPAFLVGYEFSICAIFQNEAPYLREWIEFHKLQGCQHFYLYNNRSTDNFFQVLLPYLYAKEVTLIDWPYTFKPGDHDGWLAVQCGAYKHCIGNYGRDNVWVGLFDIDEFLFCPDGQKLPIFLRQYLSYGAVCAHWRVFGTSGVEEIPQNKCLIEVLTKCNLPGDAINCFFKSIVRPPHVANIDTAHMGILKNGFFTVNADGETMAELWNTNHTPKYDKICINHYFSRTKKFFRERKKPSEEKRNRSGEVQDIEAYNQCEDTKILQFVPALRERLGYSFSQKFSQNSTK